MDMLKLIALDREDLEIVSAHLQDAVVKIGEVLWRPNENRVVIALNRFDWEAAVGERPEWRRRRAALRFDRVLSCKCKSLDCSAKEQVLNLLAVEFHETDAPGGVVTLSFSGGGALRLDVECLEVEVVDLGPVWQAARCPEHKTIDGEIARA
ncbi:DUF2948 family protein [Pseudorhodoplanes sp.]|jgi:hypothetical protein|uniref:DUF2948 family protein n=1 Tax=Pseudorhodoplanes sp. TaxID=1934341 RepID=UPI002C93599F|nr:DUF2948 family protein [Pseudorhodoplanes sp.]HWV44391.1 DUF2948 family protein [Pseudorhodoplanes sp.]